MSTTLSKISVQAISLNGRDAFVPSVQVEDRTVVVTRRGLRKAAIFDEELSEADVIAEPRIFVAELRSTGVRADLFTFAEKLPNVEPRFAFHTEYDSLAVIRVTTFKDWLEKRVEYDVRKAVRRASREGVEVRVASYDDEFVRGICRIYNEAPVRQGRSFWHYGKNFETVRRENSTYHDRSECIGAYLGDELIGFIRMIYVRNAAMTLQVISLRSHFAKRPVSALIAKAVEVCEHKGIEYFVYGRYVYNDAPDSLTEFKRRNGFTEIRLPRYFIPLTLQGRLALAMNLHKPLATHVPPAMRARLRHWRNAWIERRLAQVVS